MGLQPRKLPGSGGAFASSAATSGTPRLAALYFEAFLGGFVESPLTDTPVRLPRRSHSAEQSAADAPETAVIIRPSGASGRDGTERGV